MDTQIITPIKIILKTEPKNGNLILFLPNTRAKLGYIACCSPDEGHSEACYEYYYQCQPYHGDPAKWLNWYANLGDYIPTKQAFKQTKQDRKDAWRLM